MPMVATNHNCRNTSHNYRKKAQLSQLQPQLSQSDQPQMSQLQPQLSQFFRKNFDLVNIDTSLKDEVSLSVFDLNCIFHNIVANCYCYNIYYTCSI